MNYETFLHNSKVIDKAQDYLFRAGMLLIIIICAVVALFALDRVLTPLCSIVGLLAFAAFCCSFSGTNQPPEQ